MLDAPQVLRTAELHNVISAQSPGIAAVCAFNPESSLETNKIGSRADMLGGHPTLI
jgi:hypothetical protein